MRDVNLTTAKGGINRDRTKGGASPEVLYDLVNGFVNADGVPVNRPAVVDVADVPASSKGLCPHNGQLVVFTHDPADTTIANPLFRAEVVVDPEDPDSPVEWVHFAAPYLGYIYAAVEFENGNVYHYWLQPGVAWTAATGYGVGDVVVPTTPNGFAYQAHRLGDANLTWAPGVARTVGDIVEPTEANGFKYEVTSTVGDAPKSGTTEPTWPEEDGATVVESSDLVSETITPPTGGSTPGGDDGDGAQPLPGGSRDRYREPITWREQ